MQSRHNNITSLASVLLALIALLMSACGGSSPQSTGTAKTPTATSTTTGNTNPTATPASGGGNPPPATATPLPSTGGQSPYFLVTANSSNSSNNTLTIDNPVTNGNTTWCVMATPVWNPNGGVGVYDNHPIGTYYANNRWRVFNQDVQTMPTGASFYMAGLPPSQCFTQTATSSNSSGDYTTIDNTQTNGNPNAILWVTQVWNAGGTPGVYNAHNFGVYYTNGKWAIFNEDFAAIPSGAKFFVAVQSAGNSNFVQTASSANSSSDYTVINNALLNGQPHAIFFVTPSWRNSVYNNHPIGVYYTSGKWAIFNQDHTAIPANATFDVVYVTTY